MLEEQFIAGVVEKVIFADQTTKTINYITSPEGLTAIEITTNPGEREWYWVFTDHLGSITTLLRESDGQKFEMSFDACIVKLVFCECSETKNLVEQISAEERGREGNRRDPATWINYTTTFPDFIIDRGFTGHEHLDVFGLINMNGRVYDPVVARFLSPDPYIQAPGMPQNYNGYVYSLNNPLKYTDPSGEFITWSFSNGGFSIGFNLTPIGIPLGAGIKIGWGDGASLGGYSEVGYRVGGTGFGSGVTVSQSLDYNFKDSGWSTTTAEGAYASLGPFNAGINFSQTYDMSSKQWSNGWGVSAGVGIGNDASGIGFNVGYGSGGLIYGIGGYYNSKAWESNPVYAPDEWNDNGEIQKTNNCYSYALDERENGNYWGLQPGEAGGQPITTTADLNLDYVTNAAISDGRIKNPTLLNKLGFGKRGYYSVYLVSADGVDYHWYRQDKGGRWSHKPGITPIVNVDASGRFISNPVRANHGIYNNGGILLWVKRR